MFVEMKDGRLIENVGYILTIDLGKRMVLYIIDDDGCFKDTIVVNCADIYGMSSYDFYNYNVKEQK